MEHILQPNGSKFQPALYIYFLASSEDKWIWPISSVQEIQIILPEVHHI